MLYNIAWFILQPLHLFYRVTGQKNIKNCNGAYIVIANHMGIFDPWKIGPYFSRKIVWFCKKELHSFEETYQECREDYGHSHVVSWFRAKLTVWLVKYSDTIPVDRENPHARVNRVALTKATKLLQSGGVLGIFPTGKVGGTKAEINPVFLKLAVKTNAKIIPVQINEQGIEFFAPFVPESENTIPQYIQDIICHSSI